MSALPTPDPLPLVAEAFPEFPTKRIEKLGQFTALVRDWNARVNLVSRKDIDQLEVHHLLHSLTAAKVWQPAPGAMVLDIGTGGGFPGLPLAIVHPECYFTLVDSVGKKGRAVREIAKALSLSNVRVETGRAENLRAKFDFVFGRAVAALPQFLGWAAPLLLKGKKGKTPNGVLYFKGTLWREELADSKIQPDEIWDLQELIPNPWFADKFLLRFEAPIGRA